jgi:hypothetical protein
MISSRFLDTDARASPGLSTHYVLMTVACFNRRPGDGASGARFLPCCASAPDIISRTIFPMGPDPLTDPEIAEELARRGLEVLYLQELAAALGFADEEGWTEELFEAIQAASLEDRRRAALRTLGRQSDPPPR